MSTGVRRKNIFSRELAWFLKLWMVQEALLWVLSVKNYGLSNVTIHSLRHSFASILIQNRAAISNVSAMLGHSSTQLTLKTYTHTYADGLRGDISKMDEIFGFQAGQERGREPARAV